MRATEAILVGALLTGGCAVPAAYIQYLNEAQPAVSSVSGLGREIFASCVRTMQYEFRAESLFVIRDSAADAACDEQRKAGDAVDHVREMLSDYLKALSAIAGDKKASAAGSFDSLASAIKGQSVVKVSGAQIDAVDKVATFLGNAALGRFRRKVLAEVVRGEDANVGRIVKVLSTAVDAYGIELADEREAARGYYGPAIRLGAVNERAAVVLLRTEWEARLAELDRRQSAAEAFRDSLSVVAAGHAKLAQGLQGVGGKSAQSRVNRLVEAAITTLGDPTVDRSRHAATER